MKLVAGLMAMLVWISTDVSAQEVTSTNSQTVAKDGFAFGGGLGISDNASKVELSLRSPVLFSVDRDQAFGGKYSVVLGGGYVGIRNVPVEGKDYKNWVSNPYLTFGLRTDYHPINDVIQPYSQMEAIYLEPRSLLSEESAIWGGRISTGIDMFGATAKNLFGDQLNTAFYAQMDLTLGMKKVGKDGVRNDLFNGPALTIGSRNYF